jgi:glycosyltransferase involved in cell wall biosynthesis
MICGSGPLESDLKERARGCDGIHFLGFLQEDGVARALASSLALILPSVEEQWGLVVNEALAMGVPVLVSDNAGARDVLVRTAVNGYVFEPDNAAGLAQLMLRLAADEIEWRRLSEGAVAAAPAGDVARFVEGVVELTGIGKTPTGGT